MPKCFENQFKMFSEIMENWTVENDSKEPDLIIYYQTF